MMSNRISRMIHVTVVISLSMIITYGFYCLMDELPARGSIFQEMIVGLFRDGLLVSRILRAY